jgi:radical SAM protein with 4Fe4S-binding SPASM domain
MKSLYQKLRKRLRDLLYFACYHTRQTRLPYSPSTICIEASSFCNLKCQMCPQSFNHTWKDGHMELALFRKIIDEIKHYAFRVILQNRGEAMLQPDIFPMIRESTAAGLVTGFNTNGTLLNEANAQKLLDSGLDTILISFNGETKEVHDSISQAPVFEKVLVNVRRFLAMKRDRNLTSPLVAIQVLKYFDVPGEQGRNEISDNFKSLFKGLPVDEFVCTLAYNRSGSSWQKSNMAINPPRYSYQPCRWMWTEMVVGWNGSVMPCCMDFNEEYILGNVCDEPLLHIWNNQRMIALRNAASIGRLQNFAACNNCDVPWSVKEENTELKKILAAMLHAISGQKEPRRI